jgi:hypothetical protein
MARYAVEMNRTASTTASLGTIVADATRPRRGKIFDVNYGSEASPADNAFRYIIQRCTAAGTSTAVTPIQLDPADAVTESDAGENHTVEPTYTANAILLAIALNQRATYRWQQDPAYGLVYPATASNGFGIQTPTASAVAITATVHYEEQ